MTNIWEQNIREWYEKSGTSRLNYLDLALTEKPSTKELAHNIAVIYDRICLSSKVNLKEFRSQQIQIQSLEATVNQFEEKLEKLEKGISSLTQVLLEQNEARNQQETLLYLEEQPHQKDIWDTLGQPSGKYDYLVKYNAPSHYSGRSFEEDRQQIVPTGWDSDEDDYPLGYSPTYIPHPDDETDHPVIQPQTETLLFFEEQSSDFKETLEQALVRHPEDPYQGSTLMQEEAYRDLERLSCRDVKDIIKFLNDYLHLATKSGRLFIGEELSSKLWSKMPGDLGERIKKGFAERHLPTDIDAHHVLPNVISMDCGRSVNSENASSE